jgi:lipopolysaccharide export system protein LptC
VKKQFTLLTLIIIALLGIWSVLESPDEAPVVIQNPHFVDAYARDFTMLSMNKDGQPYYTLTADLMEHFNDSGESEISQPVFNIHKDDNAWVISADRGKIDNNNIWVTLNKDVIMLQNNTDNPLKLETSEMRFNTKTQIAHSDKQVDITQGALSLKSHGMVFNNKTGDLELLAGVNGIYVKN